MQNALIRVVFNASYRCSCLPLLKSLHWLPVEERVEYKIASMTYKARLYQQPSYLREYIKLYQPARSLRSSNCSLLTVPPVTKNKTATRAFQFAAPTIWTVSQQQSETHHPCPISSPPQSIFVLAHFQVTTATRCLCIIVITDIQLTAPYINTVID
jgi:hypothetical protein